MASRLLTALVLLCAALAAAFAQEAGEVGKAPASDWITDVAIPASDAENEAQVSDGVYYLLVSRQIRQQGSERQQYQRFARKITNRSGLESGAAISVDFRPRIETLTFHTVRIHRGDTVIDLLDDLAFSVFQRETDLEKGVLDGRLTAFVNLPTVKVGDVVEFAYSRVYQAILMGNDLFASFQLNYSSPVGLTQARIIVPDGLKIRYRETAGQSEPVIATKDGETSYTWLVRDPEPVGWEDDTPRWYDPYHTVEVGTAESWRQIAEHSLEFYPRVASLPARFEAKLDDIAKQTSDPKARISKALALVQNDIRYVGVEIGRGAFVPRAPATVISRGYGDCKDKSYLLVEALRKLGVEAYPALANLTYGRNLPGQLPSPYAFDHAIVQAFIGDTVYWLDPTDTHQLSPDPLHSAPDYGYALPISKKSTGLERIEPFVPEKPLTTMAEDIELGYDAAKPIMVLQVTSTMRDADADSFRRRLDQRGKADLVKAYLDYYEGVYPGVSRDGDVEIDEDTSTNTISVRERYVIPTSGDREALFEKLYLKADSVRNWLADPDSGDRRMPISLPFPFFHEHRITIRNLNGNYVPADPVDISEPYLRFVMTASATENSLSYEWLLKTTRDHVMPEEVKAYREHVDQIDDETAFSYDVRNKPADGSAGGGEEPGTPEFFFLATLAAALVLAVAGCWWGLRADAAYRDAGRYFPVSTTKFVLMSVVTWGTYPAFWFWKHWRWSKANANAGRRPFMRALFYPFFIYSAINELNQVLPEDRRLPHRTAIAAAAAGLGASLLQMLLPWSERLYGDQEPAVQLTIDAALIVVDLLAVLVVVRAVQRANDDNQALRKNSVINNFNLAAILLFPVLIGAAYYSR